MALTARRLPSTPTPADPAAVLTIARYRVLANTMLRFENWERAAEYEELAVVAEHEAALQQAALAATVLAPSAT